MIVRKPGFAPTRSSVVVAQGTIDAVVVCDSLTDSMLEQAASALAVLDRTLHDFGSDKHHVLTVMAFLADMGRKREFNQAWDAWASRSDPPLRACLGAVLEPGYLVELVVKAVVAKP